MCYFLMLVNIYGHVFSHNLLSIEVDVKKIEILNHITCMSGLFHGRQMNEAALTKEAYATSMSVTKSAFYLEDSNVTL